MKRRTFATGFAGLLGSTVLPGLAQPGYPDKPIRLVVPYAPGGSTSALGQLVAPILGKALGQSVFVDHRAGGNTVIGTSAVAKFPADGYSLLLTASSHVVVPLLANAPYDPFKDFTPIATLAKTEFVLVVHPAVPARDIREFLALAASKPGSVTYASAGNGSGTHLVAEQFSRATGIRMQHIPYKGSGPLITDLLSGQVQASFQTPAVAAQFVQSRRLRALLVTGNERMPAFPDVPHAAAARLSDLEVTNWFGLLGPAGLPKDIVGKLEAAATAVASQPEFKEKLLAMVLQPYTVTGAEFERSMRAESARMAKLIRDSKITMD